MTQEEANAECTRINPSRPIAKKDASGEWADCEPAPKGGPCFGKRYADAKAGEPGRCKGGKEYSFDPTSKEGKGYLAGQTFSGDATVSKVTTVLALPNFRVVVGLALVSALSFSTHS